MSNSDLNSDKKKILDEQERDLEADKDASQPLVLTDELEAEGIEMISYSKKYLYIEDYNGHSVHINLFKDSISRTLEYFDSLVDGSFNDSLKKAIKNYSSLKHGKILELNPKQNPELKLNQKKKKIRIQGLNFTFKDIPIVISC